MLLLLIIAFNLVLMAGLFLFGFYLFLQVEDKRKRKRLPLDDAVDVAELRLMLRADRYDEALQRLMQTAQVDRYTAASTLAQLRRE